MPNSLMEQTPKNETNNLIDRITIELPKSNAYLFLFSLLCAVIWTVYLSYYNSRVIGLIATFIVNKFNKYGRINIGSISMSVLSGKIMFRAVHFITEDFSVRIEYGWIIFKWWRPFIHRELGEDMSHAETRLFGFIDIFEFHVYNQSRTYDRLEKLFGLKTNSEDDDDDSLIKPDPLKETNDGKKNNENMTKSNIQWRDLVPVFKFDITTIRCVFGNNLAPNTLIVHLDESHVVYTTTSPSTPFDQFMHDVKVNSDRLSIMFVKSDKYSGDVIDEPPRMMGEGFVLMQSTDVKLHYYQDEPGIVPYEPEIVELADGETVVKRTYPTFGLDVQCGKNTDFNYGPWADRQREYLWKFFYPSDYQPLKVTKIAGPGEIRQFKTFEFRMNIVADSTNDVLFTKNSVTQAIHMNMGQGSYIEASVPWITEEKGYTSVIRGQLLLLEATTSMRYRSLLECETLDFNITAVYPLEWNAHQEWKYSFTACKATVFVIFEIKHFLTDLIADWSTKLVPDVYHFVPYTYNINILINQFELVTLCNEYNWIDTSSHNPENAQIAFCGELFDLSLQLPYTDFLPLTNSIAFIFKVETVFCRLYLPENNTSRHVMIALSENMKIVDRDGNIKEKPFGFDLEKQWRRYTERSAGWIDCWMTSNVSLTITYKYYPMPPLMKVDNHHIQPPSPDDFIGTPSSKDAFPMTFMKTESQIPEDFDFADMEADLISVELEVAPSVLCVYGSLLRNFIHLKENYFGEDQKYTDFYDSPSSHLEKEDTEGLQGPLTEKEVKEREFDVRQYRPFAVTVSVTLHDIQAHLVKNCNMVIGSHVACPSAYIERVGFEMDKTVKETKLQVLISPAVLITGDNVQREADQVSLKEGFIQLSGLQVRGHAMFSHRGLPLESEVLEYAWLVEVIVGDLCGRLTSPQVQNIVEFLQTFVMLVEDSENSLLKSRTYEFCQHMIPQPTCKALQAKYNMPCMSSEDIKYRMTRASIDSINLSVVDEGTSLNILIYPVRLSTCNLHGENTRSGITGLIEHISFKQYISTAPIRHDTSQPEVWLESGGISLGPVKAEAAMALPHLELHDIQNDFLMLHDEASLRLWFLWPVDHVKLSTMILGKCGCHGGCMFFGNNKNGAGFFLPKKYHEIKPTAVCKISPDGTDPGFGQSLLYKNKLVFDIGKTYGWVSPGKEFTFTRGYMSNLTTPDTPGTGITVIEEHFASENLHEHDNITEYSEEGTLSHLIRSSTTETRSSSSINTTTPSDGHSVVNPFESVKSTETLKSIDSVGLRESGVKADEIMRGKAARSVSISSSSSPPPISPSARSSIVHSPSSRSSVQSPVSRSSVQSSSPGSVRMRYRSQYDATRQFSTMSLDSEMYFSAEEDNTSARQSFKMDKASSGSDSVTWGNDDLPQRALFDLSGTSQQEETVIERKDLSSSSSASTLSYMSADTDPDETLSAGIPDDFSLVDLHSQVNKPITKSPVLLPCYSSHMTKLHCKNWGAAAPFPARYHNMTSEPSFQSLSSASQSVQHGKTHSSMPNFYKIKQGFSTKIMRAKEIKLMEERQESESWDNIEEPLLANDVVDGLGPDDVCRTTATVKLRGSVDILLSPLLLESFQRLCESVTPTLTDLHPSSILDGLHFRCLDRLKSQNRLKKSQSGGDTDTPDSDESPTTERQFSNESRMGKNAEIKTSSYQALITLPRINICALQAGLVEELISFSALENIQELTCVSLMGVCVDEIRCQLLSNSHSCKTIEGTLSSMGQNPSPVHSKGKAEDIELDDIPEVLRQEDVGTLNIKSVHLQLRRLNRDNSFSDDIVLTAIPEHKSKVMFSFENDVTKLFSPVSLKTAKVKRSSSARTEKENIALARPSYSRQYSTSHDSQSDALFKHTPSVEDNPFDAAPQPKLLKQKSVSSKEKSDESIPAKVKERLTEKQRVGYIMFECGFEDISIAAVKRLGYKDRTDNNPVDFTIEHEIPPEKTNDNSEEGNATDENTNAAGNKTTASEASHPKLGGHSPNLLKKPAGLVDEDLQKSTLTVGSWASRASIPSESSVHVNAIPLCGDASSGRLHLKTIWFNFAAPPPLPIKRKADFTKYDWNLLSTSTPAINAWLSPFDRLMTAVRTLAQELTHRTNTVMACIMTEGLEIQSIHMPYKSKYYKTTQFSKTLQEDASCQLLTVLRRYIHKSGTIIVENAVKSETIPQLITIQKGILALTRQWKNVLYMPQLSQYSFKSKKHRPYTVTFNVSERTDNEYADDDEGSVNYNNTDERQSLIDEEIGYNRSESVGSINKQRHPSAQRFGEGQTSVPNVGISRASSMSGVARPRPHNRTGQAHSHTMYESPHRETNPHMTSLLRHESMQSFQSASGVSADAPPIGQTPPTTPYKADAYRQNALKSKVDDLYRWMTQQQKGFEPQPPLEDDPGVSVRRQDSFLEAFGRGLGQEDSHTDVNMEHFTLGTSIMQLADAQNLFKPFLQSIGLHVENVRPTAMLKNFGGNLSLQGKLDELRIQIADSVKSRGKGKGKGKKRVNITGLMHDLPAFQCEMFALTISMKDVTDFEKKESDDNRFRDFPYKFAMHKLEAKPATLQVNFLVNCQAVTQNVDMPLLRLIHQFVTMVGNVNETRMELKQGHSSVDWIRTHRKQGSTSSGDTVHSDVSRTGVIGSKSEEAPLPSSKTNFSTETKSPELSKPTRSHKPSISSFKFPFDTIRPERLAGLSASLKKPNLKFTKDAKKKETKSPGGRFEFLTPPQSLNLSDSINMENADTSSPTTGEKTIVDEIKEGTPHCWRTLYHLLELYSTMPETKTVGGHKPNRQQLPVIEEEPSEKANTSTPSGSIKTRIDIAVEEEAALGSGTSGGFENTPLARSTFSRTRFKQSIYIGDSIPLVVFGVAKLDKVKILAVLSGLKLEAELRNVHASGTIKEKVKGFLQRKSSEASVTAHVGHTMMVLLEGPSLQTVVTVNVGKSQALHTTVKRRGKGHNSALVSVGEIEIDIPQHPVVLHDMLTRGTNKLSSTLQEFRRPIVRSSRNMEMDYATVDSRGSGKETNPSSSLPRPQRVLDSEQFGNLHIHLKAVLQGITIGASLLPSLKAQHKTGPITISGMTMKKARFTLDLPHHTLSFKSKVKTMETSIPSSASIQLPPIHVYGDYRYYSANAPVTEALTEGLMLKEGNYLNAVAEVGMFEHSLTTDLLNHLVFVQKVFMKELNELLQKVSGGDQPVPIWSESGTQTLKSPRKEQILYSFHFRLKGIQITATTPTASAVRLETEAIDLEVSNRVQMASQETNPTVVYNDNQKVFIKAQVDLNLALGQLIKNALFEEADPEFQTMAFFKTSISIRNALQDEMIPGVSKDQEALLINLTRPIVLAQPMAFDKAVLVWLNYKNAYEYWTEQRLALNKEVQTATQQVIDRLPNITNTQQQALSTLFLQLTVDDIGLCLPISPFTNYGQSVIDNEPGAAVVLTIESTQISACSSGSLVSKGRFKGFCLRIAEDFETSLDDWKPSLDDIVMNACVVPEGTYEVCSRTINKQSLDPNSNAKWIVNIKWEMQGIDVQLDTNIGKGLSALGNNLTALTGEEDEEFMSDQVDGRHDVSLEDLSDTPVESGISSTRRPSVMLETRRPSVLLESLPKFLFDLNVDQKKRARMLETAMNEQAKVVQALKEKVASKSMIEAETKKLEELKSIIFNDFRREVLSRIKKQSEKASVIKNKLGIGSNPTHLRSKSYAGRMDDKNRESAPADLLKVNPQLVRGTSETTEPRETTSSKVQFGETISSTYTPPTTPEDTPQHRANKDSNAVRKVKSLIVPMITADILSSSSASSSASSSSVTVDTYSSEDDIDAAVFKGQSSNGGLERQSHSKSTSNPSIGSSGGSKSVVEPNVDFELDVKVTIDSGKCVLHPKESKEEDGKRNKREKTPTPTAAADPLGSPTGRRKMKKQENSTSQIPSGKTKQAPQQPIVENTVFFLPGVDVKVHYNSKTDYVSSPTNTLGETTDQADLTLKSDELGASPVSRSRQSVKKASLYAWLSLQSLPEEMVMSPCLLDYLEQALEPIPIAVPSQMKKDIPATANDLYTDLSASYNSIGAPIMLGSFPVDVVVLIRVEPSVIKFNCHPVSRVECLLQVPSLELVFSTKRSDIEANTLSDGTPPLKAKFTKKVSRERNLSGGLAGHEGLSRKGSTASADLALAASSGGLSVTGCLSDFSLYIFHPYGGGQRKAGSQASPRLLGNIQEQNILGEISRKDSLSLNVEFINLNISRSRKLEVKNEGVTTDKSNTVRFSAVCDIGTAAFKYDMRRLSEILTFPKSWYHRNLARRLFLGDESWILEDEDNSSLSSTCSSLGIGEGLGVFYPSTPSFPTTPTLHDHLKSCSDSSQLGHHRRGSSGDKNKFQISTDFRRELAHRRSVSDSKGVSAPQSPSDAQNTAPDFFPGSSQPSPITGNQTPSATPSFSNRAKTRRNSQPHTSRNTSVRSIVERKSAGWETLVLYAVNLSHLDVQVNMSNVMGNTVWNTKEIRSQGRLAIDSTGHKDLRISVGLGGSHFDSKGGVVGGNIDLQEISTYFEVKEDPKQGKDPIHKACISMYALEGRVDYMGSSVLMARLSNMDLSLRDEWKIDKSGTTDAPLATTREALIFAHGDLGWDKFHMLISRSTTPDLLKIVSKLEEFIMQQFDSSKRALGAMGPMSSSVRQRLQEKHRSGDEDSLMSELRHHRHWQKALNNIIGCRFNMLPSMLPTDGMILGGTLTLRGNNLTLGCFHGINFRSKSWAIFTMSEPYICFATEGQKTKDEGIHVVQDLTFYVGHDLTAHLQGKPMAHVLKLSRGHAMPPTFTSANEWFNYAFSTSEIKDLPDFPKMQRAGSESPSDYRKSRRKDYNHDSENIFALPSLQLQLRTKHHQTENEPTEVDPMPVVQCSFVTEFEDHIFVAMDAEVLLFLHDLVMSYIKEKDKGARSSMVGSSAKSAKSPVDSDKKKMTDPLTVLQQDWRDYECPTWHLEPTIRLLHWASHQIDPVGVDYVLQKLGFTHARVTIPKWMQRGFMDPSDKILSMLVNKLITMCRETPESESTAKS